MLEVSVTVVVEKSESLPQHFLCEILKSTNIPNPCVKNLSSKILQQKHEITTRKVELWPTIKVIKIFHGSKMMAVFVVSASCFRNTVLALFCSNMT